MKILTVKVLVDGGGGDAIYKKMEKRFQDLAQSLGDVVDYELDYSEPVADELSDAVSNETYDAGDAFNNWIIFLLEKVIANAPRSGFYSSEFGWGDYNLATRYSCLCKAKETTGEPSSTLLCDYGPDHFNF